MYKFPKKERLCSKIDIDNLYIKGDKFMIYPFSVRFIIKENNSGVKILISSPKRYQRLSVNRNRAKRIMKEAYRLSKEELIKKTIENNKEIIFSVSLISKTIPNFKETKRSLEKILSKLGEKL
ncbi:MAG: ribonuclease P protein component [Bacteroidales bacterium]|jgi:ribonuclease P protein component|nr:ribonuclease P protein component [Bacteroidales bacterium]